VSTVVEKKIVKNLLSSILFVIGRTCGEQSVGRGAVGRPFFEVRRAGAERPQS
jgi:hypothetical protein